MLACLNARGDEESIFSLVWKERERAVKVPGKTEIAVFTTVEVL